MSQRLNNTGEFCCFVIKNDFSAISAQKAFSCEEGGGGYLILGIDLTSAGGNKSNGNEDQTGQLRFLTSPSVRDGERERCPAETAAKLISFVDVGHSHTLKASLPLQGVKPVPAPPRLTSRMQFKIKIGLKQRLGEDCSVT